MEGLSPRLDACMHAAAVTIKLPLCWNLQNIGNKSPRKFTKAETRRCLWKISYEVCQKKKKLRLTRAASRSEIWVTVRFLHVSFHFKMLFFFFFFLWACLLFTFFFYFLLCLLLVWSINYTYDAFHATKRVFHLFGLAELLPVIVMLLVWKEIILLHF